MTCGLGFRKKIEAWVLNKNFRPFELTSVTLIVPEARPGDPLPATGRVLRRHPGAHALPHRQGHHPRSPGPFLLVCNFIPAHRLSQAFGALFLLQNHLFSRHGTFPGARDCVKTSGLFFFATAVSDFPPFLPKSNDADLWRGSLGIFFCCCQNLPTLFPLDSLTKGFVFPQRRHHLLPSLHAVSPYSCCCCVNPRFRMGRGTSDGVRLEQG